MRVRVAVLCVVLAVCLSAAHAKLVSVTGQGVIRSTPPPNVRDKAPGDQSSEFKNGLLAITAFDEKLGVVPTHDIAISPTVTLQQGVAYDSFFLYFHMSVGNSSNPPFAYAQATFNVDNRVVGCTVGNEEEFNTTTIFGLTGQTDYPMSEAELYNKNARGYEPRDFVVGSGTSFNSDNNISYPGDYTRCFSASCFDNQGNACQCSASQSQCIVASDDYKCFSDASELVALNSFQFSSTCRVGVDSVVAEFGSCQKANGCRLHDGKVCLSGRGGSVEVKITAGCGCDESFIAHFTPSTTTPAPSGCLVTDTTIGCKTSSKILIYGTADATWPPWFQANIPGSIVTYETTMPTITQAYLQQYDLVIVARIYERLVSVAESDEVLKYLNNGGAVIALAGFFNDLNDRQKQEAPFRSIGIQYGSTLIAFHEGVPLDYNPNNPLTPGLAGGYIDFVGGWASSPYTGPGTAEFFASGVSRYDQKTYSIGQTITLPSGGRLVAWGDEWATFTARYSLPQNVDAQFWKNAVAWVSEICVPPSAPCAEKFEVSSGCTSASHTSTGKGFTLLFSDSASNCN